MTACTTLPTAYPPEAKTISAKALQERLAGQTYVARTSSGMEWDMQYGADGRLNMRTSNGAAKGRWRTEDIRLCVDFEGSFPSGCSEIRVGGANRLYLKRGSTGEVMTLTAQP